MVLGPDGGQLAVKGTTMSTEVSVEHVVPASALVEGNHTVRLEVRDDVGNVAVPVETIVMVVEPVGVFGDVNLSQPTPSSLGVSWDVHTDEPFANLTVSLNGTAIHQASIEEGSGSLTFDLLAVAADVLTRVQGAPQRGSTSATPPPCRA